MGYVNDQKAWEKWYREKYGAEATEKAVRDLRKMYLLAAIADALNKKR